LRTLGSGGSCKVKLAKVNSDGQHCAVKIMNDGMGDDEKALLKNEVEIMVKLNHDNVVNYIEWGQD
jgi:serine/threonine protein kinase